MKKLCCILGLCVLLTGCGRKEEPAASSPAVSTPPAVSWVEPLRLEELRVEFLRTGAEGALLMKAVKELPEELAAALKEAGVSVEEVSVTMSGSCASTAQAVEEGGVDLAFLPVEELAGCEAAPRVALTAGEKKMNLYAAGTEYGKNLAGREDPTWTELDHARWGVVSGDLLGEGAVELWLADHYEGSGLGDLASVTGYESWEELYEAAEKGDVDVFPAAEELEGYGLLGEGEAFYTMAAVTAAGVEDRLIQALPAALEVLREGEFGALLGPEPYVPAPEGALDPQRRLASILG